MNQIKGPKIKKYFKAFWLYSFCIVCFYLCLFSSVLAAPTSQINYQGKLSDALGNPVSDGDYNMRFRLCTDSACSSAVFDETYVSTNKITVTGGLFSVMLGSVSTTLATLDFNQALYLEVNVGGSGAPSWETLLPRKILGSVPNAFNTQKFDGLATTSFLRSDLANLRATITSLTSTNFFATNASITNATSTNFFVNIFNTLTAIIDNLTATIASIATLVFDTATGNNLNVTNLNVTSTANIQTLNVSTTVSTNVSSTNTTSTNFYSPNVSITGGSISSTTISGLIVSNFASPNISQWTNDSGYLTSAYASSTYLTVSYASSTYSTLAYNSSTFLTVSYASSTYLTQAYASSTYLTVAEAGGDYLSLTDWFSSSTLPTNFVSSSLTQVGTLTSGTWNAAVIQDAYIADNITASNYLSLASWYSTTTWPSTSFVVNGTISSTDLVVSSAMTSTDLVVIDSITSNSLTATSITLGGVTQTAWPTGGGSAGSFWATTSNSLIGYPSLGAGYAIVIGANVTTSDSKFEVVGNSKLGGDVIVSNDLNVSGTSTMSSDLVLNRGLVDSAGLYGSSGQVLWSTGTSTLWVSTSTLNINGGTETDPVFMAASTSLAYQPIGSYLTVETDPVWLAASSSYLTVASATATYLTSVNAASTYLTQATAISDYLSLATWYSTSTKFLTTTTAALTYQPLGNYLTTSTGLTVSNFSSPNISQWTNDSGYLTTYSESDPIFMAASTSLAYQPIGSYLTVESDPVFMAASTSLAYQPIGSYLTVETDPVWLAASSSYLTVASATATYLTSVNAASTYLTQATAISDYLSLATWYSTSTKFLTTTTAALTYQPLGNYLTTSTGLTVSNFSSPNISQWTNDSGYLTTYSESDPIFMAASTSLAYQPIGSYLTVESDPIWLAASTSLTVSNFSSPNISQWTNDSGYLTSAYASSTYLTISNASSTYSTLAYNSSTFLTVSYASSTYLTQAYASSTYLTVAEAGSDYLSLTDWFSSTTLPTNFVSSSLIQVGTLTSGTWNAAVIQDAYIADDITASNYLSLASWYATTSAPQLASLVGLTSIGSSISTTTFAGNLSVSGNASFTLATISGLSGNIITSNNIKTAITDLDTRLYNQQNTTKEMTGFPNRTDTSIAFDDGTKNFTITGTNFKVYSAGKEYTKNTESIAISDTSGLYFIYYDKTTANLSTSTSIWSLTDGTIQIATVYWNSSLQKGVLGDERHGLTMDGQTHEYLHLTVGTRYQSGLTGTFNATRGTTTAGVIYDEDIAISPAQQTQFSVYSKVGSTWWFTPAQNAYYSMTGANLLYNNAGTATTTVTSNSYVAYWIFATNDPTRPIISIMGQREDTTIANARANNTYDALSFGTLPFSEMKVLYRVILRNTGATPTYQETQDLRNVSNVPSGTYVASAHGALTGLLGDDHTQYLLLAGRGGQVISDDLSVGSLSTPYSLTVYGTSTLATTTWFTSNPLILTQDGALNLFSSTGGIGVKDTLRLISYDDSYPGLAMMGSDLGNIYYNDFATSTPEVAFYAMNGETNLSNSLLFNFYGRMKIFDDLEVVNTSTLTRLVVTDVVSDLKPAADLVYSLGASGKRWNNLWVNSINPSGYDLTIGGTSTLTNLSISDSVLSNILPSTNLTYSLGSLDKRWSNVYANSINASGTSLFSNITVTTTINFSNSLEKIADNLQLPQRIRNLYVADNYVYAVTYGTSSWDSFRIIDISNPYQPQVVGGEELVGLPTNAAKRVFAIGNYAYILYNSQSITNPFRIIDISDKSNPIIVGGADLNFDGFAFSEGQPFYIAGKYAYIMSGTSLYIIDISDPYNPKEIKKLTGVSDTAWDIKVVGDYAYICHREEVEGVKAPLTIVNVRNKNNPFITSKLSIPGLNQSCWSIDVNGSRVYLGLGTIGGASSSTDLFRIIDVSNPYSPQVVGGENIGSGNFSLTENDNAFNYVKILGNYLYATTWQDGFLTIDVSSSTNPVIISKQNISEGAEAGNNFSPLTFDFRGRYLNIGYAPISGSGTSTGYFRIFKVPGMDAPTANVDALAVGSLQSLNNAVFNQRVSIWDGLEVGSGGIYTQGALSVMATNTSNYFGGSIGIGTTTPAYRLVVNASNTTDYLIQVATTTNQSIFEIRNDGIARFGGNLVVSGAATSTFTGNIEAANLSIANWNTAYGWGNHALAGYLTTSTGLTVANFASPNISQWTNDIGYITSTSGGVNFWSDSGTNLSPVTSTRGLVISGTSTLATTSMAYNSWIGESSNYLKLEKYTFTSGLLNTTTMPMLHGVGDLWVDESLGANDIGIAIKSGILIMPSAGIVESGNPNVSFFNPDTQFIAGVMGYDYQDQYNINQGFYFKGNDTYWLDDEDTPSPFVYFDATNSRVSIGTTTPYTSTTTLTVVGSLYADHIYTSGESFYMNGQKVIGSDDTTLSFYADSSQNLKLTTTNGALQLFNVGSGGININSSSTLSLVGSAVDILGNSSVAVRTTGNSHGLTLETNGNASNIGINANGTNSSVDLYATDDISLTSLSVSMTGAASINGSLAVSGATTINNNLTATGTINFSSLTNGLLWSTGGVISSVTTSSLGISGSRWSVDGSNIYYTTGNVGIGSSSPSFKLSVGGNTYLGGNLTATGTLAITGTATSTFAGTLAVSGNGTSTFAGGINLTSGCFAVNGVCIGGGTGTSQWTTIDSDIYYATGKIAVGTSTMSTSTLTVWGGGEFIPKLSAAIGSINFGETVNSMYLDDKYAYIGSLNITGTAANQELVIYDISNPASPTAVWGIDLSTTYPVRSIFIRGKYAYIGIFNVASRENKDFLVYDISNPLSPVYVGGLEIDTQTGGAAVAMELVGNYAYLSVYNSGAGNYELMVIDIANPANMSVVYGYDAGCVAFNQLKAYGNDYLFAVGDLSCNGFEGADQGLIVFDISDPANTSIVTGYNSSGSNVLSDDDIDISGHYLYLLTRASTTNELQILDIKNPASPTYIKGIDVPSVHTSYKIALDVNGDYAFVGLYGNGGSDLLVYNIANPANIYNVSGLETGNTSATYDLKVFGRYLYVIDNPSNYLKIYNVGGLNTLAGNIGNLSSDEVNVQNLKVFGQAYFDDNLFVSNIRSAEGTININSNLMAISPFGINTGNTGVLGFRELAANGSNYVGFKAPDSLAADLVFTLPSSDGNINSFLTTDGSGNLSWGSSTIGTTAFLSEISIIAMPNTVQTWSNVPIAKTELFGTTNGRKYANLTNYTQFRIASNQSVDSVGIVYLRVEYSLDAGSNWYQLENAVTSSDFYANGGATARVGSWGNIATAAKTDVMLRVVGFGDGSSDPAWRQLSIQFKGYSGSQWAGETGGNISYATGNIGIGTTTPAYRLVVNSATNTEYLIQVATTTNQGIFEIRNDGIARFGNNLVVSGSATSTFAGNLQVSGYANLATTTMLTGSKIGAADFNNYFSIESTNLNDPGDLGFSVNQIPVIVFHNSSDVVNNNQGAINNGLLIIEDLYGTGNPENDSPNLTFSAKNIADILNGSLAKITFNTTTAELSFTGGSKYNFDAEVWAEGVKLTGADYAEYFQTADTDLVMGEAVCLDITQNNTVVRCKRSADSNIMGIVSSKPAIIGNNQKQYSNNPNYKIIGLLGQVPAKASSENGAIRPGDSLTSASEPGYLMKANAGDSTVGVALEGLDEGSTGYINVLISRRNKSLTVEEIEDQITDRIADMEIEDEVDLLISQAIDSLNLDDRIAEVISPELLVINSRISLEMDGLGQEIDSSLDLISNLQQTAVLTDLRLADYQQKITSFEEFVSSTQTILTGLGSDLDNLENRNVLSENNWLSVSSSVAYLQGEITNIYEVLGGNSENVASLPVDQNYLSLGSLAVQAAASFYGTITVVGEAGFESKVTFKDDVEIEGKLYLDKDQAGTAIIKTGSTTVEIIFAKPFKSIPKVMANLELSTSSIFARYAITKKTTSSFTIIIDQPVLEDLTFDWIALGLRSIADQFNDLLSEEPLIEENTDSAVSNETSSTETGASSDILITNDASSTQTSVTVEADPEITPDSSTSETETDDSADDSLPNVEVDNLSSSVNIEVADNSSGSNLMELMPFLEPAASAE